MPPSESTIEIQVRDCSAHPSFQEVERGEIVRYRNLMDEDVELVFWERLYDEGQKIELGPQEVTEVRVRDDLQQQDLEYPYIVLSDSCGSVQGEPRADTPRMKVRA